MKFKVLVLAVFLLAAVSVASADTTTLTFNGAAGNNLGGVYVYPYDFTVNGHTSVNVPMICDDYWDEVTNGETWVANISTISDLANVYFLKGNASQAQTYEEAAYLADLIFHGSLTSTQVADANWAIWEIFDPTFSPNGTGTGSYYKNLGSGDLQAITGYVNQAASNYTSGGSYPDIMIFTATGCTYLDYSTSCDGNSSAPQEFFVDPVTLPAPEPGVLLLLALGLCSIVAFRRRFGLV